MTKGLVLPGQREHNYQANSLENDATTLKIGVLRKSGCGTIKQYFKSYRFMDMEA
jgi:hypothetical protein